jgi:hypothetical protein
MSRTKLPDRRHVWRQKLRILDREGSGTHSFYVEFGEYPDGRLGEIFITAHKTGSMVRGVLDTLAQSVSRMLQEGASAHEVAKLLRGQEHPPCGPVRAEGSQVTECLSLADYIGREIEASYGEDGCRLPAPKVDTPEPEPDSPPPLVPEKAVGYDGGGRAMAEGHNLEV